jgi:hypothetical protein
MWRGVAARRSRCRRTETGADHLLGETDLLDLGRFASQPELFAAVAEAIEARTRARAVLVIFEDAHWADPGSLALLEFLSGVVAGQRLMLLVTARDDAVPLPAAAGVRSLPLAGLNREATATVWVRPRSRLGTWRRPGTLRLVARKALETEAAEVLARAVLAMGGGVGGFEVDVLDFEQESLLEDALRLLPTETARSGRQSLPGFRSPARLSRHRTSAPVSPTRRPLWPKRLRARTPR